MKKLLALVLVVLLTAGCAQTDAQLARGVSLREKLLSADGCSFNAEITADYGKKTYTFSMGCRTDREGNLTFSVEEPAGLAGISGTVSAAGGKLTFDGQALSFALLADGEVSPVSAPWLLIKTLRSGYLRACGTEGALCRLTIDDSYAQDAMQVDVWLDGGDVPVRAEIVWQGRRVLSLQVSNFAYL